MKILGTGLSGLVGSRIKELLPSYEFEDMSRRTGVDVSDKASVFKTIQQSSATVVLHLAAKTDVDGCEQEKALGKESEAWKINVCGTANIIEACEQTNKKLIYISTDMVFSGDQKQEDFYAEDDQPDPQNWYATTKYEAEKLIGASSLPAIIIRIAYPYRANFEKKEYVRVFKTLLEEGKKIAAVGDHYFTPTFIDDIAPALQALITQNMQGIFHVTGSQKVSPYEVALAVAQRFQLDSNLITQTTRAEFFKDRAIRGFNLSLNNDKITKLGVNLTPFDTGLQKIEEQVI